MRTIKNIWVSGLIALTGIAFLVVLSACQPEDEEPEPIIGDWQSTEELECNGYGSYSDRNKLEIDDDLEGEATIYAAHWNSDEDDVECSVIEYEVEVEVDKKGKEYTLKLECDEENDSMYDCSDLDFELECELDDDEMECDGDELFGDYEFEWELD